MLNQHRFTQTRTHIFVLCLYWLLSLLLTWPLVARITTHVPGIAQWAFDESTFIWNIWYFKHALVDNLSSPLHSELIYYPLGIDLILYTYNFFHALIAQPLYLAVNLPFASNVALLASTMLSGYGTFLLVQYLLGKLETEKLRNWNTEESGSTQFLNFSISQSLTLYPAVLAGLLYAFATNRAVYAALGHYDMVTTQWIPFYALMLLRSLDAELGPQKRRKAAALAGLFFAFNGLAEMITALFLAIFTIIVVVVYLLKMWRNRGEKREAEDGNDNLQPPRPLTLSPLRLVASLAITGIIAFTIWSPALLPILRQFLTEDFSLKEWGEAIPLSTDLLGWFTPTTIHPIFGDDLVAALREIKLRALIPDGAEQAVGFSDINTVFLGWVSFALALLGAIVFWKRATLWVWTTIIFGLFTLGPFLQINGQYIYNLDGVKTAFPLPYALLHYIPIVRANRAPNRNSVILMLGLAVLLGYGVYWIIGRISEARSRSDSSKRSIANGQLLIVNLVAVLILFEHLTLPVPLSDARVPEVYTQIAADPAPGSVMHLPLGWRNSFGTYGPERTRLEYFQSTHGKPMLGGNISRAPDFKMDYFKRIPFFQAFRHVQTQIEEPLPDELRMAAEAQAPELMYLYDVEYVLLMPPIEERFPYASTWQNAWPFAKETLPLEEEPFWTGDGIEAYRVVQPDGTDQFLLDLGTSGTFPYRGEGWDAVEVDAPYDASAVWVIERESRLFVPLRNVDAAATYAINLRAHPFTLPQSVSLSVNGEEIARQALADGWQELTWQVPGALLVDGLNRVVLQWDRLDSPCNVNPTACTIGNTGVDVPVDLEMNGFEEGGFIALWDDGEQIDASAGRRGVNVTVLDAKNGELLDKVGFDTAANEFESQALADYLATVEEGRIVLATTRGAASDFLTADAVDGLRNIGADVTLDGLQGNYFSIAGVQGAAPGSAIIVVDAAGAYLGVRPDRRSLAGAVDWVTVERK